MANLNNNNVYGLVPELGDLVTFITHNSSTTGRIIFRSEDTIRIRPYNKPSHGVEFELNPATGEFLEKYGVTEIIIHEKRRDPHFSIQLAVSRGDSLEFYDLEGVPLGEPKTVFEIYASETHDGVKFDDGTVVDFGFLGVPEGVGVIMTKGKAASPEDNSEYEAPANNAPEIDIEALIRETALVKEVPSEELVYDDSIQREDMFVSLLMDIDPSQQQNPRIMQRLYRITDLMLALKNAVRVMPAAAATPTARSFTASTILEALAKQPQHAPVAAVLPVAAIKRVIYGDVENVDNSRAGVEIRKDLHSVAAAVSAGEKFDKENAGAGNSAPFVSYVNRLLKLIESYSAVTDGAKIQVDQEVIRTAVPPATVDGLPAFNEKDASIQSDNVTKLRPQIARLLSKSEIIDHKRGTRMLVAPADTAETVGHMLASPSLTLRRAPNRSSVLIWDVLASTTSRTNVRTYADELESQVKLIDENDEFTLKSLIQARVPQALSFVDRNVAMAMDTLGLRDLEMTTELMDAVDEALIVGQQNWNRDYKTLLAAATEALRVERGPALAPIGVFPEIQDEPVYAVLQAIKERERTLNTVDIAIINELNKEAEGTLTQVYYGLLSGAEERTLNSLKTSYLTETARQQRNIATQYAKSREFASAPEIVNCPHVHEYELIMKVKDDQKRMILFEKFFGEYQAGQKGDYYVCGTCQTNLVCKHEVLMLQEYLNQKESASIHKDLLLKFAGPVFEGNYTCKNCGQKIQEIEYDTSLEFDDEGRPLIGRSIVEEAEEGDEIDDAIMSDKYQDLPFDIKEPKGVEKLKFYRIARTIMESIGYVASKEVYARMLNACIDYFEQRVPFTKAGIDNPTTPVAAAVKKKYKSGSGFFDTYMITAIGALVLMEFQINNPDIPISAPGCAFSRSGFPRDGSVELTGRSALDYVLCAISSISLNVSPWSNAIWASLSDTKARLDEIGNKHVVPVLNQILGSKGDLTTVSANYREMLEKSRLVSAGEVVLQTDADLLPPSFRPLPRFDTAVLGARKPIGNMETFMSDVKTQNIEDARKYTYDQERLLIHEVINDFHTGSQGGSAAPVSKRSDGDCCFGRLSEVSERGFGLSGLDISDGKRAELQTLFRASNIIHHRDPTAVNAGTHFFVPWSAPQVTTELPKPAESSYYQLFLKHCSKGARVGYIHEFDTQIVAGDAGFTNTYICRHCEFQLNDRLFLSIPVHEKDDKTLYGRIASELVGNITPEEFKQLEQDVRKTKLVTSHTDGIPDVPATVLLLNSFDLIPSMKPQQTSLAEFVASLNNPEFEGNRKDKFVIYFGKIADAANSAFKQMIQLEKAEMPENAWKFIKPVNKSATHIMSEKMARILNRLSDDALHGPRNILHYFVVNGEQLHQGFFTSDSITNTTMSRWFGKYTKTHKDVFVNSWSKHYEILELLKFVLNDEFSAEDKESVKAVLSKFTSYLGPLTQQWVTYMHPSPSLLEFEIKEIYKWIATTALAECMNVDGVFYSEIPSSDARRKVAQFMKLFVALSLEHAETNITRFQKTPEEIREAINARITNERAKMVQRIDKEARADREITLINKKLGLGEWNFKLSYESNFKQAQELGLFEFDSTIAERGARPENAAEAYGLGRGRAEGGDGVGEHAHGEFAEQ